MIAVNALSSFGAYLEGMNTTTFSFDTEIEPFVDRRVVCVSIDAAVSEQQRRERQASYVLDQEIPDEWPDDVGVHYGDSEELRCGDKERERDLHRWELNPASAEDYFDRART